VKHEATPSGSEFEAEFASPGAFLSKNAAHAPLQPTASWLARARQARLDCGAECWQAANALLDFDLLPALRQLRCPALLLTGEQSPFRAGHDAVVAAVPQLEAAVLPDARFAIGWERAPEVARRLLAFTRTAAREGVLSSL
jgi:pimeloyl-ACP methyl ester carboxylesterase